MDMEMLLWQVIFFIYILGTLTQDSGVKEEYTGDWVEDKMEGEGIYKYKSGAEYEG